MGLRAHQAQNFRNVDVDACVDVGACVGVGASQLVNMVVDQQLQPYYDPEMPRIVNLTPVLNSLDL